MNERVFQIMKLRLWNMINDNFPMIRHKFVPPAIENCFSQNVVRHINHVTRLDMLRTRASTPLAPTVIFRCVPRVLDLLIYFRCCSFKMPLFGRSSRCFMRRNNFGDKFNCSECFFNFRVWFSLNDVY